MINSAGLNPGPFLRQSILAPLIPVLSVLFITPFYFRVHPDGPLDAELGSRALTFRFAARVRIARLFLASRLTTRGKTDRKNGEKGFSKKPTARWPRCRYISAPRGEPCTGSASRGCPGIIRRSGTVCPTLRVVKGKSRGTKRRSHANDPGNSNCPGEKIAGTGCRMPAETFAEQMSLPGFPLRRSKHRGVIMYRRLCRSV